MANKELRVKIQDAYDTEFNWKTNDPVLLAGQVAFSSDKYGKHKVGDGVKTWNQLEYVKTKWEDIDGKPSTFNPPAHTHTISQISDIGNANVKHANTAGSANAVAWANVSGKPATFNPATHNHDDRYYTEAEVNTKLSEKANTSALTSHTDNTGIHVTSTEKTNWNAAKTHADKAHAPSNAQVNQNAFSNVSVGETTIAADTPTDTLTLVAGSNVQITPDATNDKITISATDTKYTHPSTHPASIITQDSTHRFVSDSEKNTWNGKADANHNHNYAGSSSAGGAANSAVKLATARTINGVSFDGTKNIEIPNSYAKNLTSEDLNTILTAGNYFGAGGNTVKNKPSGVEHFGLTVYKVASGHTAQKLHGSDNVIYYRVHNNTSFGSWYKVYSSAAKPTPAEIGAAPTSHTHTPASIGAATASHTHSASQITGLPNVVAITNAQIDSLTSL